MAPVSSRTIVNARASVVSKNQATFNSRIPLMKPVSHANKISKSVEKNTTGKNEILKDNKKIVSRSINGKMNILKPPIKKVSPTISGNLDWTKPKSVSSLTKSRSIVKAKTIRARKSLKQTVIPSSYLKISASSNLSNVTEKENKMPATNSKEQPVCKKSVSTNRKSLKELQGDLNIEFLPCELSKKQILNCQKMSYTQLNQLSPLYKLNKETEVTKQLEHLKISNISSCKKLSTAKFNQKSCVPNEIRRCTWAPGALSAKKTVDPFQVAMDSIKKLPDKRRTRTPPSRVKARVSLFQSAKKPQLKTVTTPASALKRETWAPGKQSHENKQQIINELKELKERRLAALSRQNLFTDRKMPMTDVKNSSMENFGRQTWSAGKMMVNKKTDPYEVAMAQIKELKAKTSTSRHLKSAEKLNVKSTPTIKIQSPLSFYRKQVKVDPYEMAMAQIKDLPLKITPSRPRLSPARKISTPIQASAKRNFGDSENKFSPQGSLPATPSSIQCTPRRVRFDLCNGNQESVYRPIKSLIKKSILKKQRRLTDISEHSETESARSSEVSVINKDDRMTPPQPQITSKFLVISKIKHIDECDNLPNLKSGICTTSKLRKVERSTLKSPCKDSPSSCSFLNQAKSPFSPIVNFWSLTKNETNPSGSSSLLHTPKALHPFRLPHWTSPENLIEQGQCEVAFDQDAPILTPLVLKNIARSNEANDLLGPIKQKLKFSEESVSAKPCEKTDIYLEKSDVASWLGRFSNYNNVLTKSRQEELFADDECMAILKNQRSVIRSCRNFLNPVAKILSMGDEKHFVPIVPEIAE